MPSEKTQKIVVSLLLRFVVKKYRYHNRRDHFNRLDSTECCRIINQATPALSVPVALCRPLPPRSIECGLFDPRDEPSDLLDGPNIYLAMMPRPPPRQDSRVAASAGSASPEGLASSLKPDAAVESIE